MEVWRDIPGYAGRYKVSSDGQVWSTVALGGARLLSVHETTRGYLKVQLIDQVGGKRRNVDVHRLVALTFISPPPSPRHQVNHDDGNKKNNSVGNLAWATPSENVRHSINVLGHKLFPVWSTRPVALICTKTRKRMRFASMRLAGEALGVGYTSISRAARKDGTCKGHKVKYV